jgi:metallo-beta-lactamase family protein
VIQVRFCGAAGEVTGSGYWVETPRARVLVDFGIFQGGTDARVRSRSLGPVEPGRLDAVVLTHAHIDHSGRLPLLVAEGYAGPLHATPATLDLTEILLADLARIEEQDVGRENRHRGRSRLAPLEPMFTPSDVDRLHARARPLPLGRSQRVAPGVRARLYEAGHILGSASVELAIDDGDRERLLVFSGDVGPCGAPILRDPEPPPRADLVFVESTYGGRERPSQDETVAELRAIVRRAAERRERILVPAFAVGRTQALLYHLAEAIREGAIPELPIYLDSPMAAAATNVYARHRELYDEEFGALVSGRQLRHDLRSLRIIESAQESKALNESDEPCLIISASGMCDGGRIVHHLRHTLWRENACIVLVGYMARGTLGRALAEGAERVEVLGEEVPVRARVHRLDGFSAHAGHSELVAWLAGPARAGARIALTHGEDEERQALHSAVLDAYGIDALRPAPDDVVEL